MNYPEISSEVLSLHGFCGNRAVTRHRRRGSMSRMMKNLGVAFLLATIALAPSGPALGQDHSRLDAERIGTAAATKATTTDDGVVRIAWARNDVPVKVDGMPLKPFAGLGSWAAFTKAPHGAMAMGDTVVFQDEVTPAMDAAFAAGLEVTGLHNHFFFDETKVYFMHVGGQGEPEKLAAGIKAVWDAVKTVRAENAEPAKAFSEIGPQEDDVDPGMIEEVVGHKSQAQQGVVKVTIGRDGTMHGVNVGGSMGLTTWAAFSGGQAHT